MSERDVTHPSGAIAVIGMAGRFPKARNVGEFWQAIDVNMSVAGSYAWNFHNPTGPTVAGPGNFSSNGNFQNTGNSGLFYPFHPDHNSFQVDQVWFDIGKETTDESRAGFHTTILYGTTATFLG